MTQVRKLQYIGNQYLLNIPVDFVRVTGMHKADYLAINYMLDNRIEITKIAESITPRADVILNTLLAEANGLNAMILGLGAEMDPGEYAMRTLRLSHVHSKIRKLRRKMEGIQ